MLRWIVLILLLACIYWIYERDYRYGKGPAPSRAQVSEPGPTLAPGGRLGGGLNPFVTDTDVGAPPQRP